MTPGTSRGLRCFFEPKSIAVAGVSSDPNKLGSIIFTNLLKNAGRGVLRARIYALNPSHAVLFGKPCYDRIQSLPEAPELLIVAVPAALVLGLVRDAAEAGVGGVVLITSGYAEAGRGHLEKEIGELASREGMRILGPNTIGLLDTQSGVDTLFLRPTKPIPGGGEIASLLPPLEGGVVVITQSGHLGEIVSEELASKGIGIRALVGTGNQLDVSVEDVIDYFADDPGTKSIALYLEGLRDGRRFLKSAVRAVKRKPLIVYKVGKTNTGALAAKTHTASLVGNYQVYSAAFKQAGIIEAHDLQGLVDYCASFSMSPRCAGRRLVIVTNAGGVGVVAADEAERLGLLVRPLDDPLKRKLNARFHGGGFIANASLGNPVDLTASVSTKEFADIVETVLESKSYDMALILPTHQTPAMDYDVSTQLSRVALAAGKPVSMCVMGHSVLAAKIHDEFTTKGIPTFPTPERAVRALAALPAYESSRRRASSPHDQRPTSGPSSRGIIQPGASLQLEDFLRSCGIASPSSKVIRSLQEARRFDRLPYPVACKLLSRGLIHKSDVGGVILDVNSKSGVASAFSRLRDIARRNGIAFDGVIIQRMIKGGIEAILGGTRDSTFGPVVIFGLGGVYTELTKEFALSVAPVSPKEAREMIRSTRLESALNGYRGSAKVDVNLLSRVVSNFSSIFAGHNSVAEIEVNPLLLVGNEFLAIDARAVTAISGRIPDVTDSP